MTIRLDNRTAIVTGAGGGLGRAHALALAARGARVLVNDLNQESAELVCSQIKSSGGEAIAFACSVTDPTAVAEMVSTMMSQWGRVDILINNAGTLRDKTFGKMPLDDFRFIVEVHLMGAVNCTKAVWDTMQAQQYGRIVMTSSSSGLWGNFGQANYGAAKMALVGLMQTIGLEGERYNIRVNSLAPTAATKMTANLLPEEELRQLTPESVSPAVVFLASDQAPSRCILCAGAGSYERAYIVVTHGAFIGTNQTAADQLAMRFAEVSDLRHCMAWSSGAEQRVHELQANKCKPTTC
jgi:NAD(P)-dependent dehydrogenase (short-subunit alcohol dehydrogenase family)